MMRYFVFLILFIFIFSGCTHYSPEEKEKIFRQYYTHSKGFEGQFENFSAIQSIYIQPGPNVDYLNYSKEYLLQTEITREYLKDFSDFLKDNKKILKSMGIDTDRELETLDIYGKMLDSGEMKVKQKLASLQFWSKEDEKKRDEILSRFTIIYV